MTGLATAGNASRPLQVWGNATRPLQVWCTAMKGIPDQTNPNRVQFADGTTVEFGDGQIIEY